MAKTHQEVIADIENILLTAITEQDYETLKSIIHPQVTYTNENGELFIGFNNLQINNENILSFQYIKLLERNISIFNNVAIVNSFERRKGKFRGLSFNSEYRITRTWKFCKTSWILIATSTVVV